MKIHAYNWDSAGSVGCGLNLSLLMLSADTFVNSLDTDQARHFVGPDLVPNCLTL